MRSVPGEARSVPGLAVPERRRAGLGIAGQLMLALSLFLLVFVVASVSVLQSARHAITEQVLDDAERLQEKLGLGVPQAAAVAELGSRAAGGGAEAQRGEALEAQRLAAHARATTELSLELDRGIQARIRDLRLRVFGTFAAALVLLLLALSALVHVRLTLPVRRFVEDLRVITRGNLEHKVRADRDDELGQLAERFNEMTTELKRSRDRLRDYNRGLARSVEDRTQELARRNLELNRLFQEKEQAYLEMKATQTQMIQQERMATLGQLLAGIAHEINNPVNFMLNAIRPLEENVRRIDGVLTRYGPVLAEVDRKRTDAGARDSGTLETLERVMRDIGDSVTLIRSGADRTAKNRPESADFQPCAAGRIQGSGRPGRPRHHPVPSFPLDEGTDRSRQGIRRDPAHRVQPRRGQPGIHEPLVQRSPGNLGSREGLGPRGARWQRRLGDHPGQRLRHPAGGHGANLRAVLHDEGAGGRYRAGPVHQPQHRAEARRAHRGGERRRAGEPVHGLVAPRAG
jgi:HAMP domain-containing protein